MVLKPLTEVLAQLREDLVASQEAAQGKDLQFKVQEIEVELQVATTLDGSGKIGFKVGFIEGEAAGA